MRKHLLHIIVILFLAFSSAKSQQEIANTLFTESLSLYNPAFAVKSDPLTINILSRTQWNGIEGSPQLQSIMGKTGILNKQHGIAFNLTRASAGIQNKLDLNIQYAYALFLNKNKLNFGVNIAGRRFTNDFTDDRLIVIDGFDNDPSIERIKYSSSLLNFGAGVVFESEKYYFGLSVPRLLSRSLGIENALNLSQEVKHYHFIAAAHFNLNHQWKFIPALHYKQADNAPFNVDVQSRFQYQESIDLGINIRSGGGDDVALEAVGFTFGLRINQYINTFFAYEFNLTSLRREENGTFELLLSYSLKENRKSFKIQNPRFY